MTPDMEILPGTRITTYTRDGLVFDVADTGPLDGEVIVLLHGFPQMATSWAEVTCRLNAAGYRTLAPDQRGYSPRARPKGRRSYKVANLAADIVSLVETIGVGPVHLVGHDWGAFVGWTVAGYYPELVRTWTSVSLPHPKAFLRSMMSSPQALHSWYMLFFQLPWLPEFMLIRLRKLRNKMLADGGMDAGLIARYEREMVAGGALAGGIAWYRALPFFGRTRRVRVPTTHIWSAGDVALERRGAELCGKYVDAPYQLVVLEQAKHWIPDQNPDVLAELILASIR